MKIEGAILALVMGLAAAGPAQEALAQTTASLMDFAVTSTPTRYRVGTGDDPSPKDYYGEGDAIELTATFDKAVTVVGRPHVVLSVEGNRNARYDEAKSTAAGPTKVIFVYTVQGNDRDNNGIDLYDSSDRLFIESGGNHQIYDAESGEEAVLTWTGRGTLSGHKIDGRRKQPYPLSLEVTSKDGGGTYGHGTKIVIGLTMSGPVTVRGRPRLRFELANRDAEAIYDAQHSTDTVVSFTYQVRAIDWDSDGITLYDGRDVSGSDSAVTLPAGAEILNARDTSKAADLIHPGRGKRRKQKVIGWSEETTDVDATGRIAITGRAEVPQTLNADTSSINDEIDGLVNPGYTYQWSREDADGGNSEAIPNATGASYTLSAADAGKRMTVKAMFTDDRGNSETSTSEPYPADGTVMMTTTGTRPAQCTVPSVAGRTQIWSATLETVEATTGRIGYEGHINLSDTTFEVGGETYTIRELVDQKTGAHPVETENSLLLTTYKEISDEVRRSLRLHIFPCGGDFALSDSVKSVASGGRQLSQWRNPNVNWSAGSTHTLYMTVDASAPRITSAKLARNVVGLEFSENLDEQSRPLSNAFQVRAYPGNFGDTNYHETGVDRVEVSGNEVTLWLDEAVETQDPVVIWYRKPYPDFANSAHWEMITH